MQRRITTWTVRCTGTWVGSHKPCCCMGSGSAVSHQHFIWVFSSTVFFFFFNELCLNVSVMVLIVSCIASLYKQLSVLLSNTYFFLCEMHDTYLWSTASGSRNQQSQNTDNSAPGMHNWHQISVHWQMSCTTGTFQHTGNVLVLPSTFWKTKTNAVSS